jgi:hypothetical protein
MTILDHLLALIDSGYNKAAWHGPNLRGSIRQVDEAFAVFRPAPGRKCIWEIVVHAAYWKYASRRRLLGEKRGSFPLKGSNWFARPDDSGRTWSDDVALLDEVHRSLRKAIAGFDPKKLERKLPGSKVSFHRLISGIAMHDVYHAGQIQTLKRLAGKREELA